jgi:hypothetical protein
MFEFIQQNARGINKYLVIIVTVFLLTASISIPAYRSGDGQEYMLMTQAIQNHLTANVTVEDIKVAEKKYNYQMYLGNIIQGQPHSEGFFETKDELIYSYHFWMYSVLVTPIKVILDILKGSQLKAFQITNAIMFIIMLVYVNRRCNIQEKSKLFLNLLLVFNPIIFYITWTHTEVFTFACTVISLIMFGNKKYRSAILIVSIGAMQNPTIIFLGGMYFFDYIIQQLRKKEVNFKDIIITWLYFIPFFIPFIFYYTKFGTWSIIGSTLEFNSNSLDKIWSLFFDLNMGMVIFIPLVIILFLAMMIRGIIKLQYNSFIYLCTLIIIAFACTPQRNWNSGMSGINRYGVWILPIVIYFVVIELDKNKDSCKQRVIDISLLVSVGIMSIIILFSGGLVCNSSYLEFSPTAKFVLDKIPSIYNPEKEIFGERTLHKETAYGNYLPIIYSNEKEQVRKILVSNDTIDKLIYKMKINDQKILDKQLLKNKDKKGMYYLNFTGDQATRIQNIIEKDNMKYEISGLNITNQLKENEEYIFNLNIKNLGNQVYTMVDPDQKYPIGISYHWLNKNNDIVVAEGVRSYLTKNILPGETENMDITIKTPNQQGEYRLALDMVQEYVAWFNDDIGEHYVFNINVQ